MPERIKGRVKGISCMVEEMLKASGLFVLVKAGGENPDEAQTGEHSRAYTRVYQLKLDGELLNTYVKFVYDEREGTAEVKCSHHSLNNIHEVLQTAMRQGGKT